MQIHELNNFSGDLDSNAYLAVDNGTDTGKVSAANIVKDVNEELAVLDTSLNARIDNIIAGGDAPSAAEVTDARLGAYGGVYASLGSSIRTQVTNESEDSKSESLLYNLLSGMKQGYYGTADGVYNSAQTKYVCSAVPIAIVPGDILYFPNIKSVSPAVSAVFCAFYEADMTYISSVQFAPSSIDFQNINANTYQNAAFVHLSFNFNPNTITPATAPRIIVYKSTNVSSGDLISKSLETYGLRLLDFSNKSWNYDTSIYEYQAQRIGLYEPIVAKTRLRIILTDANYKYAVFKFSSTTPSAATRLVNTGWLTTDYVIERGEIFLINMRNVANNTIIRPDEGFALQIIQDHDAIGSNYSIGSDFIKKPLDVETLGQLSYLQAFCKYNNNYYSIDGSNIAVQDSDFNQTQTAALSLGHGNALQLGSNGKAYASGWNDGKVYVVDLATLTIVETITLPTGAGYTTCAVDDVNKLVYIFYRSTYPDTVDYYDFIVYDYDNDQIISTKKIPFKFGGMQSCDYLNGRILVLYGLGSGSVPNGYKVFNTNGDVISEYVLGQFSTQEPEGVCIDRNTQDILISMYGKTVYKIG